MSNAHTWNSEGIYPTYLDNRVSPFHACYANEHTVLRLAVGRFFVDQDGVDPAIAYWAYRRSAAIIDTPERPVEIAGADAVAFLERLFTRPIANMKPGRGRYVLACTHDGGLFMDGILFRMDATRFWFVQPDCELDAWLLAHRVGFEVSISDPDSRVLQIQGPKSHQVIHAATGGALDETFKYFQIGLFDLDGQNVYISRTGWTGEFGYEIYTLGNSTDCPKLWDHLMGVGKSVGMAFSTMQSINIRRIEAGILDSGSDFDATMTPFEAGLDQFVDLSKEGFIGREALLDAKRGTRLYGLRCDATAPSGGDLVLDAGNVVGRVTTGAYSPYLETGIGYVRFDFPGQWCDRTLVLRSTRAGDSACTINQLPFYDANKRLPRGLPLDDES